MLKAEINVVYTAEMVRAGTNRRGEYEMVLIKSPGNDPTRIPVWVKNVPCGVVEGGKFVINAITGASIKHFPPSDRFDKWQTEFSIDAVVAPV